MKQQPLGNALLNCSSRGLPAGGLVGDMLKQQGAKFEYATARLEDRAAVLADLERVRAGGTGALQAGGVLHE